MHSHILSALLSVLIALAACTLPAQAESSEAVTVSQDQTIFSVVLPTELPILCTQTEQYVATNAMVVNNGYGPIQVTGVSLSYHSSHPHRTSDCSFQSLNIFGHELSNRRNTVPESISVPGNQLYPVLYGANAEVNALSSDAFCLFESCIILTVQWF